MIIHDEDTKKVYDELMSLLLGADKVKEKLLLIKFRELVYAQMSEVMDEAVKMKTDTRKQMIHVHDFLYKLRDDIYCKEKEIWTQSCKRGKE